MERHPRRRRKRRRAGEKEEEEEGEGQKKEEEEEEATTAVVARRDAAFQIESDNDNAAGRLKIEDGRARGGTVADFRSSRLYEETCIERSRPDEGKAFPSCCVSLSCERFFFRARSQEANSKRLERYTQVELSSFEGKTISARDIGRLYKPDRHFSTVLHRTFDVILTSL